MAVKPALLPVYYDIDFSEQSEIPWSPYSLSWKFQIENIKRKVSRAIGLLKYCRNFVSMETLKYIYRRIVEPHINYCCSVWGCSGSVRIVSTKIAKQGCSNRYG